MLKKICEWIKIVYDYTTSKVH
ncbi:Protein of unknown function [Bacillus cereus]|nr:Protein of unknown function [Bacillus cereus]